MARLLDRDYDIQDGFLSATRCRELLADIAHFRSTTKLPEIHREARGRALRYSVIDGYQIRAQLPDVWNLYIGPVRELLSKMAQQELDPLESRAGVNVNIMAPGRSEYRWHFDRVPVTAVLYLNEVSGGETELYPNVRFVLANQDRVRAQKLLDRVSCSTAMRGILSRRVVVSPRAGRIVTFEGNRCWHSVRGVEGGNHRVNILLAYDREGAPSVAAEGLDAYLYSNDATDVNDPNYTL